MFNRGSKSIEWAAIGVGLMTEGTIVFGYRAGVDERLVAILGLMVAIGILNSIKNLILYKRGK